MKSVNVLPGGFFSPDAVNVQFSDDAKGAGRGISFVNTPALAPGDIITVRNFDGKSYYTVPGEGRPNYFHVRNGQ